MSAVGAANCRIDGCLRACRDPPPYSTTQIWISKLHLTGQLTGSRAMYYLLLVHEHSANEKWRAASQPPWMRP